MPTSTIQRSFAGGELAPALHARADQQQYIFGLKTCRNFLVQREGGATNRAGFRYVDTCKTATSAHQLLRYVTATAGQGILIEAGVGYFRFYENGALVTVSGVAAYNGATAYVPGDLVASAAVNYYCIAATTGNAPPNATYWHALTGDIYEVPTPYGAAQLPLSWVQSQNVITLTHHTQPPRELTYSSLTRWVLSDISTAPAIDPPGGLGGLPGAAGLRTFRYVITTAQLETYEESIASAVITVNLAADPTETGPVVLTWAAVAGAAEYYVYADPFNNGTFGFIGTTTNGTTFHDTGFVPDYAETPPIARILFGSTSNYPSCAAYYQQRRFFANTDVDPGSIFGSRTQFHKNFTITSPTQDDNAVTLRIAGDNHHPVRHMKATKAGLLLFTDAGEWTLTGSGGPKVPITPQSLDAEQELYTGASATVPPVVIGNAALYPQARGSVLREAQFAQQVEGLAGKDLTLFSTHLFKGKVIAGMDYQQVGDSIVWVVLASGELVGLTYVPEQAVLAWHRHDSGDGLFEACCVVPEADQDVLYVIVRRIINGATVRYVERLENRVIVTFDTDAFFVDCGLSYSGAAATHFSGLDHLEGELVAVVADGAVIFNGVAASATAAQIAQFTVVSGAIDLDDACTNAHFGLAITAQLQTLPLDVQGSELRDKRKRLPSVSLLVESSSRLFQAGADADNLRAYDQADFEDVTDEFTGIVELSLTSEFNPTGSVLVQQTQPMPITVLGIIPNVDLGG